MHLKKINSPISISGDIVDLKCVWMLRVCRHYVGLLLTSIMTPVTNFDWPLGFVFGVFTNNFLLCEFKFGIAERAVLCKQFIVFFTRLLFAAIVPGTKIQHVHGEMVSMPGWNFRKCDELNKTKGEMSWADLLSVCPHFICGKMADKLMICHNKENIETESNEIRNLTLKRINDFIRSFLLADES